MQDGSGAVQKLRDDKKLEKPLCDLPFSYEEGTYIFNPFRLNSCGWDGKKNKVFVKSAEKLLGKDYTVVKKSIIRSVGFSSA